MKTIGSGARTPLGFLRGKESERPHLLGFFRGRDVLWKPSGYLSIVRTGPVWQESGRPHTLGLVGGKEGVRPHPLGFARGKRASARTLEGLTAGRRASARTF